MVVANVFGVSVLRIVQAMQDKEGNVQLTYLCRDTY